MKCEYCNNVFKTKWNLKNHQKLTKYCLKLQEKTKQYFVCDYCKKSLSSKSSLDNHKKICKYKLTLHEQENLKLREENLKLREENIELKAQIKIYKELSERELSNIEEIAKQPKNTTNNTHNNNNILMQMSPLDLNDKEKFKKIIQEQFNHTYMLEGQKGVAKFAVEKLLRDENNKLTYVCCDPSRQIYRFKSPSGDLERDVKAKKLAFVLHDNVVDKSFDIIIEQDKTGNPDHKPYYKESCIDINNMKNDDSIFRSELASLIS